MSNNFLSNPFPVIFATLFCIFCPVLRFCLLNLNMQLIEIFQNGSNQPPAEKANITKTDNNKPGTSRVINVINSGVVILAMSENMAT